MGSIILFDRNSQVDRVDSLRRAENGDFHKKKRKKKRKRKKKQQLTSLSGLCRIQTVDHAIREEKYIS